MPEVTGLGHVGIICDDFLKMRDFYTRVIGLTVTDEDPDRGSCFLSADPGNEHHELNLERPEGRTIPWEPVLGPKAWGRSPLWSRGWTTSASSTTGCRRKNVRIASTITHGISLSIYFYDPEDNYSGALLQDRLQRQAGLRRRGRPRLSQR